MKWNHGILALAVVMTGSSIAWAQTQMSIGDQPEVASIQETRVAPTPSAKAGPVAAVAPIPSQTRCEHCYGNCPEGNCASGSCGYSGEATSPTGCGACGGGGCSHCTGGHSRLFANPVRGWWYRDVDYFTAQIKPPCPGYSVNHFIEAQKLNGRVAQMVFHGFHFKKQPDGSLGLTQSGRTKVYDLVRFWHETPGMLTVHPTGVAALDQQRVSAVQMAFAHYGVSLPAEQISLGKPVESSLTGEEANQIFLNRQESSPLNPLGGTASTSSSQATRPSGNR